MKQSKLDYTAFSKRTKVLIESEVILWLTSTSRDLTPQPRPVWFIWHEESFLIFSRPNTYKIQQMKERPNVSLHFNSDKKADNDVVIFRGQAVIDQSAPSLKDIPAYAEKYKSGIKALDMNLAQFNEAYSVPIRVQIRSLKEG